MNSLRLVSNMYPADQLSTEFLVLDVLEATVVQVCVLLVAVLIALEFHLSLSTSLLHPWRWWVGHQIYHPDFCSLVWLLYLLCKYNWKLYTVFCPLVGAVSLEKKKLLGESVMPYMLHKSWFENLRCKVEICNFLLHKRWNSGKFLTGMLIQLGIELCMGIFILHVCAPQRVELCQYSFSCLYPTRNRTLSIFICMFVPYNVWNLALFICRFAHHIKVNTQWLACNIFIFMFGL